MQDSKIIIITGANSGIGKEAAYMFAKEGHTVIMACRNLKKSQLVQQKIIEVSNNKKVDLMKVDMGSFASIQEFATAFMERYERLDILIHNAAYFNHGSKYRLSSDQIELTFATNTFGPYLLTKLLLMHLRKSKDARILHASSNIIKHFFGNKEIDFSRIIGEMEDTKGFSVYDMYCQSKMALVLLTFKMAQEYKKYGIKVNALQINGAKMSKEALQKVSPRYRVIGRIQNLFFPPPTKMAQIYYHMCMSEEFRTITGKLINDKQEVMDCGVENPGLVKQMQQVTGTRYYPSYASKEEYQEKIWRLCLEVTKS